VDDTSDFLPAYSGWFGKSMVLLFVVSANPRLTSASNYSLIGKSILKRN
jgi:hypothetical protein